VAIAIDFTAAIYMAGEYSQPGRSIGFERANVNPSLAHMFIVNPLKGKKISTLFSTHTSTEERISRLRSMQ
jgi:heat shock protein HtpX